MSSGYNEDARYYVELKDKLELLPLPHDLRMMVAQYMHWTMWDKSSPPSRVYTPPYRVVTVPIDGVLTEVKVWLNNDDQKQEIE